MIFKTFLFSLSALAVCATTHASVSVVDTFVAPDQTRNTYMIETGSQIGQAFMTGSSLLTISNVVFPQVLNSATTNLDDFHSGETFGLYASNPLDGTPILATPIYTFSLTDNTQPNTGFSNPNLTFGVITATAPSGPTNVALAPNTRYWLVLTYGSDVAWDYTQSTNYSNQMGVTIPANNSSFYTDSTGTAYSNFADGPQLVTINAVPEPSTYCLLAVAGLALVVSRNRLRKLV